MSVYDTTSVDSFNSLQTWYNEMGTYCTNPDAVTMLVGNKTDRKVCNVISGYFIMNIQGTRNCVHNRDFIISELNLIQTLCKLLNWDHRACS